MNEAAVPIFWANLRRCPSPAAKSRAPWPHLGRSWRVPLLPHAKYDACKRARPSTPADRELCWTKGMYMCLVRAKVHRARKKHDAGQLALAS